MKLFTILILIFFSISLFAQSKQPKIVVGIVVDQMRYDYLEKYYDDFSEEGFKKIITKGSNFTNCHINYIPTATGPGHASIYTGTTPFYHGIVDNDWKNRKTEENIYCTDIKIIQEGYEKVLAAPTNLFSTTIGDQLKLTNNLKSKVVSISIKDRAAILSGGQSADIAYWYNYDNGHFITSDYYLTNTPNWVNNFNKNAKITSYLDKEWNLLKPKSNYSELKSDNLPYETDVFYEGKTSFPHSLKNVPQNEKYEKIIRTPWGNQIVVDFVKEAIVNENLGDDNFTDLLAISFSSPDKIGHDYGPHSYEVKDTYLRLDEQIADLINFMEAKIGKDNFILFLTADHGVMHNIDHMKELKIKAGKLDEEILFTKLQNFCLDKFNTKAIIKTQFSRNIFINYDEIEKSDLDADDVENAVKRFLLSKVPEIGQVFTRSELEKMTASRLESNYILNGFNNKRSGDILYSEKANHIPDERKYGSSHGSRFEYDNHIPLIFYGFGIQKQTRNEKVFIVDIAATIADLIGITKPSDCIGIPLLK